MRSWSAPGRRPGRSGSWSVYSATPSSGSIALKGRRSDACCRLPARRAAPRGRACQRRTANARGMRVPQSPPPNGLDVTFQAVDLKEEVWRGWQDSNPRRPPKVPRQRTGPRPKPTALSIPCDLSSANNYGAAARGCRGEPSSSSDPRQEGRQCSSELRSPLQAESRPCCPPDERQRDDGDSPKSVRNRRRNARGARIPGPSRPG